MGILRGHTGEAAAPGMAAGRTSVRAVGGILEAASAEPHESGAGVTRLIRGANMPHGRISGVLRTLVSQGLLEQVDSGGACRYRISQSGRDFLRAYRTFSSFADDFGLSV